MSDVAYIGRKPCGCAVACAVVGEDDGPWRRAAVETDLAWWRRDGLTVEETTVARLRGTLFGCRCGAGREAAS